MDTVVWLMTEMPVRLHAAWTAFWHPTLEVRGTVGVVRVSHYGRTYGVYVPLDANAFEAGLSASVCLVSSAGVSSWLEPLPLPGLRLRLPPSAFGAVRALRLDPLDEGEAEEFSADAPLP